MVAFDAAPRVSPGNNVFSPTSLLVTSKDLVEQHQCNIITVELAPFKQAEATPVLRQCVFTMRCHHVLGAVVNTQRL